MNYENVRDFPVRGHSDVGFNLHLRLSLSPSSLFKRSGGRTYSEVLLVRCCSFTFHKYTPMGVMEQLQDNSTSSGTLVGRVGEMDKLEMEKQNEQRMKTGERMIEERGAGYIYIYV